MRQLVILGGGTAGTMAANKLRRRLGSDRWQITVVDQNDAHAYQPGFLFIPFGTYQPAQIVKSRRKQLDRRVDLVLGEVDRVDSAENTLKLTDGRSLAYD
jgi:sulfide:quinone oxidoreductase